MQEQSYLACNDKRIGLKTLPISPFWALVGAITIPIAITCLAVYCGVVKSVDTSPRVRAAAVIPRINHFQRSTTCQYCNKIGGAKPRSVLTSCDAMPEFAIPSAAGVVFCIIFLVLERVSWE